MKDINIRDVKSFIEEFGYEARGFRKDDIVFNYVINKATITLEKVNGYFKIFVKNGMAYYININTLTMQYNNKDKYIDALNGWNELLKLVRLNKLSENLTKDLKNNPEQTVKKSKI